MGREGERGSSVEGGWGGKDVASVHDQPKELIGLNHPMTTYSNENGQPTTPFARRRQRP